MFKAKIKKVGGTSLGIVIPKNEVLYNKYIYDEWVKVNIIKDKKNG